MKNSVENPIQGEIRFLLSEVLRAQVFTLSPGLDLMKAESYYELLDQVGELSIGAIQSRQDLVAESMELWETLLGKDWADHLFEDPQADQRLPSVFVLGLMELLCLMNPDRFDFSLLNIEVVNLLLRSAGKEQSQTLIDKIRKQGWFGTVALKETRKTFLQDQKETKIHFGEKGIEIDGSKSFVPFADESPKGQIQILSAINLETGGKEIFALMAEAGEKSSESNGLERHSGIGDDSVPLYRIDYKKGLSRKFQSIEPLPRFKGEEEVGSELEWATVFVRSCGLTGLLSEVDELLADSGFGVWSGSKKDAGAEGAFISSVLGVNESLLFMRCVSEGLRGSLYQARFYNDCETLAPEKKKLEFTWLGRLYSRLLLIYSKELYEECLFESQKVYGYLNASLGTNFIPRKKANLFENSLQNSSDLLAFELVYGFLLKDKSAVFKRLMQEFESIGHHEARSEHLTETIATWKDYLGGLIVHLDDLATDEQKDSDEVKRLHVLKTVRLLGDLLLCDQLIRQGLAAEKKLMELEVNFFRLKEDAEETEGGRIWYNKLVLAEYFALHHLSKQEGMLRILKRKPLSVPDYLT